MKPKKLPLQKAKKSRARPSIASLIYGSRNSRKARRGVNSSKSSIRVLVLKKSC